jgi:hypothetical protein
VIRFGVSLLFLVACFESTLVLEALKVSFGWKHLSGHIFR